MKLLLNALKQHGIGVRAQTEDDFWRICESEQIKVEWTAENCSFYLAIPELSIRIICLPKRRKGLRLLFAMFHELGHHFAHTGKEPIAAFEGNCDSKDEFEADAVAMISIIPRNQIEELAAMDGTRFGDRIWRERCQLWFLYGV